MFWRTGKYRVIVRIYTNPDDTGICVSMSMHYVRIVVFMKNAFSINQWAVV